MRLVVGVLSPKGQRPGRSWIVEWHAVHVRDWRRLENISSGQESQGVLLDATTRTWPFHGQVATRRTAGVALVAAGLVVLLDQGSKAWVIADLHSAHSVFGVVTLVYAQNAGIAAGLLMGSTIWVVVLVALLLLGGLFGLAVVGRRSRSPWLAWGLVVGGTVSNVIDRFHYGAVTDVFAIGPLRKTNLADLAIVVGTLTLLMLMYTHRRALTAPRLARSDHSGAALGP